MNRSARFAVAALLLVLLGVGIATADNSRFLGRTHEDWAKALQSDDGQEYTQAAWALCQIAVAGAGTPSGKQGLDDLCLLARSDRPTVRYWGVLGLGRFVAQTQVGQAERTTARAALEAALKDETSGARLAAAEALALAGESNKGLPVLIEAMESPQESVRIQAVAALAKLGPAARPALATLKAATTDSSEYVKRISSRALAQLGEP
jgi:hypothetical protein